MILSYRKAADKKLRVELGLILRHGLLLLPTVARGQQAQMTASSAVPRRPNLQFQEAAAN